MAAPSIIFFDEFDAIVPRREMGISDSRVSERVISQLLTEMDGLLSLQNVLVLAATNRPDIIDPAVMRPGRFDRIILVPAPDDGARLQVLKIHTKDMPLAKNVDLQDLAKMTAGYSGADLEALCREAAMTALRKDMDSKIVTPEDFKAAMKEVLPSITSDMEKWYQDVSQRFKVQTEKPIPAIA